MPRSISSGNRGYFANDINMLFVVKSLKHISKRVIYPKKISVKEFIIYFGPIAVSKKDT